MSVIATRGDELNHEKAFALMAALDTHEQVIEALKEEGVNTTPGVLKWLAGRYPDRLAEARNAVAPRIEKELTNGMLSNASRANAAIATAIELTQERLDAGVVQDPSKVARDLADVAAKMVDKKLALEGRPTSIVEKRETKDLLRALEAKGVVVDVEPITEAEVVEDAPSSLPSGSS